MLFFDGLQHAAREEDTTLVVVRILYAVLIGNTLAAMEEVVVVGEIDLDASRLNRRYLDQQRMVRVVDDQVHTREANHFVQLVATLVDVSELGHEGACLKSFLLKHLRQAAIQHAYRSLFR